MVHYGIVVVLSFFVYSFIYFFLMEDSINNESPQMYSLCNYDMCDLYRLADVFSAPVYVGIADTISCLLKSNIQYIRFVVYARGVRMQVFL